MNKPITHKDVFVLLLVIVTCLILRAIYVAGHNAGIREDAAKLNADRDFRDAGFYISTTHE